MAGAIVNRRTVILESRIVRVYWRSSRLSAIGGGDEVGLLWWGSSSTGRMESRWRLRLLVLYAPQCIRGLLCIRRRGWMLSILKTRVNNTSRLRCHVAVGVVGAPSR